MTTKSFYIGKATKINPEAIIWLSVLLTFMLLPIRQNDFSLCILHHLGFRYCPGCGIGHSIQYALHGNFLHSLESHPLGILVVVLFLERIVQLLFTHKNTVKKWQN